MQIFFNNETHNHLLFIDSEWDGEILIQFSGILFEKRKNNLYELISSFNFYVKEANISHFFTNFTGITPNFLNKFGLEYEDLKLFWKEFTINYPDLFIIGHNIESDKYILWKNGIDLNKFETFCTYTHYKDLFPNERNYNVKDIAEKEGWFLISPHDSYCDAWALVPIFSCIKELEHENTNY